MFTASAAATRSVQARDIDDVVVRADLIRAGCTTSQIGARIAAGRWQRRGKAIVLHNGPLTRRQRWRVALLNDLDTGRAPYRHLPIKIHSMSG